jgi:hypothetical protein
MCQAQHNGAASQGALGVRTVSMRLSSTTRFQNCDVVAASKWNWKEWPGHSRTYGSLNPKSEMSMFVPFALTKKSTAFVPIDLAFAFDMKAKTS